jgi:hypothetical protein
MRLVGVALVLVLGWTGAAAAQTAPKPTDPNPAADPPVVLAPLQLALVAPDLMPGERYAPGCNENAVTNGNSAWGTGVPLVRSLGYQLSPRLSVLAFSRLGCPITSGLGGAAAYAMPIGQRVAFALSGGLYGMPQVIDRGWAYKGLVRAGLVWRQADGNVAHTGLEAMSVRGTTRTGRLGVTYGFSF